MLGKFFASVSPSIAAALGRIDLDIKSPYANKEINQLLEKTVLAGGKRLRPLLTYLAGDFFGVPLERLHHLARSIEQVHAASLAHDDVVDNATTRRGRPSINALSSNKHAVLGGDYLLAHVIVNLCQTHDLRIVSEMAHVIEQLAQGEWVQLEASYNRQYSHALIEEIAHKKTASVMSWCFLAPAIEAGLNSKLCQMSKDLGVNLGLAFQLMDDVLDFSETSQKDPLLDMENGMANGVIYEWLMAHPDAYKRYQQGEALKDVWALQGLPDALSKTEARALAYLDKAKELLKTLENELSASGRSPKELAKKASPLELAIDFIAQRSF